MSDSLESLRDLLAGFVKELDERDRYAARLAEAERDRLEATMLLFDWEVTSNRTGSVMDETRAYLKRVGYDPMTATLRAADSASVCLRCHGTGAIDTATSADDPSCPDCDGEGVRQ